MELNACRNVLCPSFGVAPIDPADVAGDGVGHYTVIGTTAADKVAAPAILCALCRTTAVLVSNAAILEELQRLASSSAPKTAVGGCRTAGCANHGRDLAVSPDLYHRFGHTASGSPRYRCRACAATFSTPKSVTHRLHQPDKTLPVFKALINKVPMRRLCDLMDVSPQLLYQRIGWIYERCRAFTAQYEAPLWAGTVERERMHIAVDRQEHMLNSGSAIDRRPVVMQAMASAEAYTGYILLQNLNFDPDADPFEIELAARECGDPDAPRPFRRYARLVLPSDDDVNDADGGDGMRPMSRGMAVHEQIAMAAHVQALRGMSTAASYVQLSMDREPGLERLALITFAERVKAGTVDAYFVRIAKVTTQAQKRQLVADAAALLRKEKAKYPDDTETELLFRLIDKRYKDSVRKVPEAKNRWVAHPFQTMSEPERAVLCLTDNGERPRGQIIQGFARASLRTVDRYFMQVRRKIHVLERPISTSSQANRRWYGYSAYSPLVAMRLLEIFRVVYNFHLVGLQDTTPAQRLGLVDRSFPLSDILRG